VIPNLAGLTPQQRQALLAQQQRFMVTSDVRRMLIRPPSSGVILPPGRIMLTSNGPASLMPGVSGRLPGVATTSSGMSVTVPPTPVTHRLPEKRKYDALRFFIFFYFLAYYFQSVLNWLASDKPLGQSLKVGF